MKSIKAIFFAISIYVVLACASPKPGYNWNYDELIDNSNHIVLATMINVENKGYAVYYTLRVIKNIKGTLVNDIIFGSTNAYHKSNTFNNHSDSTFWNKPEGRSEWPCCICGPDHTFIKDNVYLLFPDSFGATKSAEIIMTEDDEWLKYVINRVSDK